MNRRTGTTLIEVLVSIFVMGVGLLAVLTLFPLGAMNMAQAIRDDRIAHLTANATALTEARDLRSAASLVDVLNRGANANLFDNPNAPNYDLPNQQLPDLSQIAGYDGPSYPVYLDPFGYYQATPQPRPPVPPQQRWVGDQPPLVGPPATAAAGAVPRCTANFLEQARNIDPTGLFPRAALTSFAPLDDIHFAENGTPDLSSGEVIRDEGFSYGLLFRRPRRSVASVVDMWVVVYAQRPLSLTPGLNPQESTYDRALFDTNRNVITVQYGPSLKQIAAPQIKNGGWVLDATITTENGLPKPHGYFYRVTDVNDLGTDPNGIGSVELTIEGNLKDFPAAAATPGVAILMEGVAEVIYKGSAWKP